jgi:hypothetical protein
MGFVSTKFPLPTVSRANGTLGSYVKFSPATSGPQFRFPGDRLALYQQQQKAAAAAARKKRFLGDTSCTIDPGTGGRVCTSSVVAASAPPAPPSCPPCAPCPMPPILVNGGPAIVPVARPSGSGSFVIPMPLTSPAAQTTAQMIARNPIARFIRALSLNGLGADGDVTNDDLALLNQSNELGPDATGTFSTKAPTQFSKALNIVQTADSVLSQFKNKTPGPAAPASSMSTNQVLGWGAAALGTFIVVIAATRSRR